MTFRLRRASFVLAAVAALTAGLLGSGASADTTSPLISGQVLRSDGSPLANAVVRFGRYSARSAADGSYYLGISAEEPTARLEVQNAGAFTQPTGMPAQFEMRWQSVTVTDDTRIDFTLPPVFEQTFVVENSSGEPVSGSVSPQQPEILDAADPGGSGTGLPEPVISQQIDPVESGKAALVFADRRLVGLEASGFPGTSTDLSDSYLTQDVDSLNVGHGETAVATLPATGSVALVMRDFDGSPVADVSVYLKSRHGWTQGRTDAEGIFRGTAERGEWPISLRSAELLGQRPPWSADVTRTVYDHSRWVLNLPDTQFVPVKVTLGDGSPAAGATVHSTGYRPDEVPPNPPAIGVAQTLTAETDDSGLARIPAFVDPFEPSGLPEFTATASSRFRPVDRWTQQTTFTINNPAVRRDVHMPTTTTLHGPVLWRKGQPHLDRLISRGKGVLGWTAASDSYRLTAASDGATIWVLRPYRISANAPRMIRIAVPLSSDEPRVRAPMTPPDIKRLTVSFEHRDGDPAVGGLWIENSGLERADRAEVFAGLPAASVRQYLVGEPAGESNNVLWAFADHDVQRLEVYKPNPDGTKDVVAVVKHLRLLDDRRITVVVGTAGNPVIQ